MFSTFSTKTPCKERQTVRQKENRTQSVRLKDGDREGGRIIGMSRKVGWRDQTVNNNFIRGSLFSNDTVSGTRRSSRTPEDLRGNMGRR